MRRLGQQVRYIAVSLTGFAFFSTPAHSSFDNPLETYIAHGETVPECGFAPVLFIDNCTAALVHPKVVLYAAHCGKNHPQVHFTHQKGQGRSVSTKVCKTHPKYSGYQGYDYAFCVLNEPITDIPYVPVAFGCEVEKMGQGTPIVQSGFGSKVGKSSGFGTKRWGENTVARLSDKGDNGTVTTSPSKIVGCPGDSGGPLLTKLEDGSWRTIGMASTIDTGYDSCGKPGAVNTYAYAKASVAWVEQESGIDITPCFEPDGTWKPTEECKGFYKGSAKGHGTWANGCEGTPVTEYSGTCGEPFGGENKAPTVEIVTPEGGLSATEGDILEIKVKAQDDGAVAKVELQLEGKTLETDEKAPFEFKLDELKVGEYEIKAIATDDKDKQSESDALTVTIKEAKEDEKDKSSEEDEEDKSSEEDESEKQDSEEDESEQEESEEDESEQDESEQSGSNEDSKESSEQDSSEDKEAKKSGCDIPGPATPLHLAWIALGLGLLARTRRK